MPWYTRPCLAWLETLDLNDKYVFEYGCGVSSKWYSLRGATGYGVDDQKEWTPKECGFKCTSDKNTYLEYVSNSVKYYLIIIDGIYRDDCTEYAMKYLAPGGYLIADNFEQPSADLAHWPKTRELTKHLPLTIYKEPEHEDWKTAVWHNV